MNTKIFLQLLLFLGIIHLSFFTNGQEVKYLGKVIDSETQKPISNANVILKGTTNGTFTNFHGYFEIVGSNQEIVISHVGYETVSTMLDVERPKFQLAIPPTKYTLQDLRLEDSVMVEGFNYNQNYYTKELDIRSSENAPLEITAEFPGGLKEFHNYLIDRLFELSDSITNPVDVIVRFSILEDGSLKVDSILNGINQLNIIRNLFESSPKWIPAFQRHSTTVTSFEQSFFFNPKSGMWSIVEQLPEYPGGMSAFYRLIGENMNYPKEAKRGGIEGRVYVSFVINKTGELEEVKPERALGYGCDEEAVRLVMLTSGKWIPGNQRGRPVKVRMVLPIIFRI